MSQGLILRWLKDEGQDVEAGEPIVEVEAEKTSANVEAPTSGVLHKILAEVDEVVEVRSVLAVIDDRSPQP